MPVEAAADEGEDHAIAAVMDRRRAQVRLRIGVALLLALAYGPFMGWSFSALWLLSYCAMQLLERRAFPAGATMSPHRRRLALAVLVANSLLFGAVSAVGPFIDGAWSVACLGFLLGGAILNCVTATIGSRPAFLASFAPFVFYIVAMPAEAIWAGANGAHAFMIFAAGGLIIASAVMMWRVATASQRAQAEAELSLVRARNDAVTANRAKSDFLANMSHEIRTPLNGVLGMAQAMAAGELDAAQRERLDVVRHAGEALLNIVNDVLDLSKIEAGKLELEHVEFALSDLTRGVAAAFAAIARQKGLSFELVVEPAAEGLYGGDPTRIRQILFNLISNALKFTDAGAVQVRARRQDDLVEFVVQDTGIGMSRETLEGLFAKFVQADASTTRRFGGTGLGLSICRELASLMGGEIAAMSELGAGSTFTVRLRLQWLGTQGARPAKAAAPERARPVADERALRVLAAEDNEMNRFVLKTLLEQAGIAPTLVEDGRACVEAWEAGRWDLILMDVQMPVTDGPAATRIIRGREAERRLARTPIIALTANAMSHQVAEYLAAGMDGHVSKPIDAAKLFEAIEAALDSGEGQDAEVA